jgi:hypothetical protein
VYATFSFSTLVIVNSATINMGVQVSQCMLHIYAQSDIDRLFGSFAFSFQGTSILISVVAALIYISTNTV